MEKNIKKTELRKFEDSLKQIRDIKNRLRSIRGWNADDFEKIINLLESGEKENLKAIEKLKVKTIKLKDIAKKLNLYGIPYSWKENSFKEFLTFNGYKIVNEDYADFQYEDIKAYLDLEVTKL